LTSPEAPIVLLEKLDHGIAPNVAPHNPYLGVMLPYTPLHWLMLKLLDRPVVATSGNLSDEPMCTQNDEALSRLQDVADWFLMHDRPIERHVDDSIVRIVEGREMVTRRARGYAPLPIPLPNDMNASLAVGAHLKSAIAFSVRQNAFVSQHIGDLESVEAYQAFGRVIEDVETLYHIKPEHIACDAHPDYASSQLAHRLSPDVLEVQHHYAHVLSCMADNELAPPCLGVAWDGVGLGSDGTLWGGEFLQVEERGWQRVGHLGTLKLPGGDKAVREPWRLAVSVLYEAYGSDCLKVMNEIRSLSKCDVVPVVSMLEKNLNCPVSSGAGRLFDAVSALCGICLETRFEGQAAMELEFACLPDAFEKPYNIHRDAHVLDWRPAIVEIVQDLKEKAPVSTIAGRFHAALVRGIVEMVLYLKEPRVVLTGGCFQNRILLERTIAALRDAGIIPYWHQRVPTNDGGICVGQLMAINREFGKTV
jgi:hydrogenase maturation protein HypF